MSEKKSVLEKYPEYRVDIGIEVHVQLNTKTKIFCACSNAQTDQPNAHVCPVCAGYPGVLPVLNKEVVHKAIQTGLATNCSITKRNSFARKHYFYPDLPKNYQITQDSAPICTEGYVTIEKEDGTSKKIRLIRIHMEEDAGKNIHSSGSQESFVDLNRTGTPLLEIVSYPDIESTHEVRSYLKNLRNIVVAIGATTGNMEEGSFRADTNISVRKKNDPQLGTRCELKNINSFKFITDAVEYEIERQISLLEEGEKIVQQTRLWDTKEKRTFAMRSKEEAADYRYMQDPDLPFVDITEETIEEVRKNLPELPEQKLKRLCSQGLTPYEANILIEDFDLADYYEAAYAHTKSKLLINWILRELVNVTKAIKQKPLETNVTPEKLATLVDLIDANKINNRSAQQVFEMITEKGGDVMTLIKEHNLEQVDNTEEIKAIIQEIISTNPDAVVQYKQGKMQLFGFFVGLAMQKTKGKADPKMITQLLKEQLT